MKLIDKLKGMLWKKNNEKPPQSSIISFEVIQKSKEHSNREYHYKALIRLDDAHGVTPNFNVIAGRIQQDMGFHPIGYHYYDVNSKKMMDGLTELTWKSWDSCD